MIVENSVDVILFLIIVSTITIAFFYIVKGTNYVRSFVRTLNFINLNIVAINKSTSCEITSNSDICEARLLSNILEHIEIIKPEFKIYSFIDLKSFRFIKKLSAHFIKLGDIKWIYT